MPSNSTITKLITVIESNPGKTGKKMEDKSAYFVAPASGACGDQVTVAVVADGIGGQAGGEDASRIAIESIKQYFQSNSTSDAAKSINSAIEAAHNAILQHKGADPKLAGMGSTITLAVITADRVFVGSLGDSRAYVVRGGAAKMLTTDHTWVQEAIAAKRLTPEEAKLHPNRNVLKRYLGMIGALTLDDPRQEPFGQGDTLLLCTDGLTDLVADKEIEGIVATQSPQASARKLVNLALERGGHDNISVVLVRMPGGADAAIAAKAKVLSLAASPIVLAVLLLGVLCVFGTLAFLVVNGPAPATVPPASPVAEQTFTPVRVTAAPTPVARGTLMPTVTPFPTFTPVPTSTPYRPTAPALTSPTNGQVFDKEVTRITLSWTSAGELPPDVYYVVTLNRFVNNVFSRKDEFDTRETRYQLPPNVLANVPVGGEARFEWAVSIRRAKVNVDGSKEWDPSLNVPSHTFTFSYRSPTPTPVPTPTSLPASPAPTRREPPGPRPTTIQCEGC